MNLDANFGSNVDVGESSSAGTPASNAARANTNGVDRPHDIPPQVARRAVEWWVELQSGDVTDATRLALQQWLQQHPDHERAWRHIEAVNHKVRKAASPLAASIVHAALTPRHSTQRREAIKTLAVALFAGGAALVATQQTPWREWLADERTHVGERRTITLADGTTVTLNTDSAINVRFSATHRRVRLIDGEMLVSTGKDADHNVGGNNTSRPFIVETAQGELQPLGTRFAVHQQAETSRVEVFEGAVIIRPRDVRVTRTLRAGEQARFTRNAIDGSIPINDANPAWVDGILISSGMRLSDFLTELSRYRPGRLNCDPAIANLRVSGSYPLANTDRILDTLRTTLPVEIHFFTRYWVTVRASST